MTVLAVLTVLKSTLPSFCLSYKIQCQETTVTVLTVLAVLAVVTVPVVTATPLKLNPPFSVILIRLQCSTYVVLRSLVTLPSKSRLRISRTGPDKRG